jgi:hypothetical protein
LGTVAGDTGGVEQNDKAPVRLRVGEGHKGWILRAVRRREAVFEKNNLTATLALPSPDLVAPKVVAPSPMTDPDFWNR